MAYLAHHAGQFGTIAGPVETDMAAVLQRKRDMVNREIELHLQNLSRDRCRTDYGQRALRCSKDAGSAS